MRKGKPEAPLIRPAGKRMGKDTYSDMSTGVVM